MFILSIPLDIIKLQHELMTKFIDVFKSLFLKAQLDFSGILYDIK